MRNGRSVIALLAAVVVLMALPVDAAEQCDRGMVRGLVRYENVPLPGTNVTLTCAGVQLTRVTDVNGGYVFPQVPVGRCMIDLELEGLNPIRRPLDVVEGPNDRSVDVMTPAPVDEPPQCCSPPCGDVPAASPTDQPSCSEYELNSSLIAARKERNDGSAIALLETRLRTTVSMIERHRIAGALLGTRADAEAWKLLVADAEVALRFPLPDLGRVTPELEAWCSERGLRAADYCWSVADALGAIGADRRSHELLLRALSSGDWNLITLAVDGLGRQHDESVLPMIEEMIGRAPALVQQQWLPQALATFESEAADAIALKHADETSRAEYLAGRKAAPK